MADYSPGRDQNAWKFYWHVDIPGLTEERAESLVARYPGMHGTVVDPKQWFTAHMDRETAEVLRNALLTLGSDGIGVGLREIVDEWLVSMDPGMHNE